MKKQKVISKTQVFTLIRKTKDSKTWYELAIDYWGWPDIAYDERVKLVEEIMAFLGPRQNNIPQGYLRWRIWNKLDAEKKLTYCLLRWA